jgi:hypothetical protein
MPYWVSHHASSVKQPDSASQMTKENTGRAPGPSA